MGEGISRVTCSVEGLLEVDHQRRGKVGNESGLFTGNIRFSIEAGYGSGRARARGGFRSRQCRTE